MSKSNVDFGKKKTWSLPSKKEVATEVVQDLEREAKHFKIFKLKESVLCTASWGPQPCGSKNLWQISYSIFSDDIQEDQDKNPTKRDRKIF